MKEHIPFTLISDRPSIPNYLYFPQVFSLVECKKIITMGLTCGITPSVIGNGIINPAVRNSDNSWIPHQDDSKWVYERLSDIVTNANTMFGFELNGFNEPLQFTQYDEGQHYKWHVDTGEGRYIHRKLSMVVNLTDPRAYEGGRLQIFSSIKEDIPNDLGGVIVFPSFKDHRVNAIKSGTRHSLVSWVSGPPFK